MTKQQMIALFIAMIITSALVSAATVVGGIWYINKSSESASSESGVSAFWKILHSRFLTAEEPTSNR